MTDVGKFTKVRLQHYLKSEGKPPVCEFCKKPLKENDLFVSKGKRCINTSRLYHMSCYESLYVDLPDLPDTELDNLLAEP